MVIPDADCQEILAGVSAYLDGEADAAACERIERHSRACPSCTAVVASLREAIGLCREASHAPLPDAVRAKARASIANLLKSPSGEERRPTDQLAK
jgi:anti-sigma factor RsiW